MARGWASGRGLRNTDQFSNLHPALNGMGPGGGRGYEIGKSTGGGSYGGVGTGGLSGGVAGLVYGDDLITDLVGGSGVVMPSAGVEMPEAVEVHCR